MLHRLALFCVRRRRSVLVIAALVLVSMAAAAPSAFRELKSGGFDDPASDSSRVAGIVNTRFGGQVDLVLQLVPRYGRSVSAAPVTTLGTRITTALKEREDVDSVESFWTNGYPALRAADRSSGLIVMHVRGGDEAQAATAERIIAEYARTTPDAVVRAGGRLGTGHDLLAQIGASLAFAEGIAVPLTLVLLLLVFGNLLAAVLPLLVGTFAVAGTFAELALLGRVTDVSVYAINLTTALGLGLAVDYSLLMVSRFREELQRGATLEDAVVRTVTTAGRTILFSSAIVASALAALWMFPVYFLRSFALAGVGVVVISMATSVLVLPALLATFGHRVASGRLAARDLTAGSPFWRRTAVRVMARPLAVGLPLVAILLLAAIPLLTAQFGTPDDRVLRTSEQSRQVGDDLRAHYAVASSSTIDVVVEGTPTPASLRTYTKRLDAVPGASEAGTPRTTGRFAYYSIDLPGDSGSDDSRRAVAQVRALPPPGGTVVRVGGATAALLDSGTAITGSLPLALLWIALSTGVLLFLFTGSVLLPVKALLLNLVSLSAVFGLVVVIFQDGLLADPLGFTPGPLNASIIVLLFCVAFGLSMDYEVFLLARIKEAHDRGGSTRESVADGLARTGRIVSTAAALLAVTFFAFAFASISFLQMFGIGTGIAILIDATLVRGLLVPAFMVVAGEANWWAPSVLRRLHSRYGIAD